MFLLHRTNATVCPITTFTSEQHYYRFYMGKMLHENRVIIYHKHKMINIDEKQLHHKLFKGKFIVATN